jgi:O-antigen/teichoic acid export membrane protein
MAEGVQEDLLDTPVAGPRVIRGGLLRLAGHVVGAVFTVASSAVVIRHLGVVDTGRFVTVMALVTIVGSISDLGISAIGVREYSVRPRDEGHRFLRNVLGIRVAFALLGLAVAVAFAAVAGYTRVMVIGTLIAGFGMVLFVVQQSQAIPLHVKLRFGWVAAFALLLQAGVAVAAVVLAVTGASLLPFFALQLVMMVPILALTAVVGGRETRALPAVDVAEWKRMLARILPYSAAVILSVLYFRVAQIMVSLLSTDLETGYFGVSFRVLESITMIPPLLVSSALPILARAAIDDPNRFAYASRRLVEAMLIVGTGLALCVFLGAKLAVDIVAGAGFGPSVEALRILAVALVGTFVISSRGYALLSLDRMRAILVSNAVALAVVGLVGVPLISAQGAKGAAVTLMAAELSLAFCYDRALSRGSPGLALPLGFALRVALAALLAAVPPMLLGLPPLPTVALGAAIYCGALQVLNAVPTELREALLPRTVGSGRG